MKLQQLFNKFYLLKQKYRLPGTGSVSMNLRLFLFLLVLVITIILGAAAILFITGTFTAGLTESQRMVENEINYAEQRISRQYGDLSVEAIEFSRQLSRSMESKTEQLGVSLANLNEYPGILEELISAEFERTLFTLQRSKSSGVFFILNATINPALAEAENSKAGLYIKNMEPNIISASTPNITVLRGIPSISRNNALSLHTQWKMEFDVNGASYYHRPINAALANSDLPLSRLYYWHPAAKIPDTSEEVMLCSVPLVDSKGNVFGVCGIEISSMLFKLSHMPDNNYYKRLFCVLSPCRENSLDFQRAMLAGGYSARSISQDNNILNISADQRSFSTYSHQHQEFLGMHKPVQLYPNGSAFAAEKWMAVVMIPKEDIVSTITRINLLLIALLMSLAVLGIVISFILSKTFLKPINEGLDIIKSKNLSDAPRSKIAEINDLIDYLAVHNRELYEKARQENLSISILDEFLKNTKELSPAERSVFDLYTKGHTAKEIAEILCLSINTIKTHTKKIYMKLNIASRDELLLYISMLDEIGIDIE